MLLFVPYPERFVIQFLKQKDKKDKTGIKTIQDKTKIYFAESTIHNGRKAAERNDTIVIRDIFKALTDPNSLYMFKDIAEDREPSQRKSPSTKQFYSSISKLKRAKLIVRRRSNYELTSFGKLVRDAIAQIEIAVSLSLSLKAWDIISSQEDIRYKHAILQSLVKDERIRYILLKEKEKEN
jgi:hypothetical protein